MKMNFKHVMAQGVALLSLATATAAAAQRTPAGDGSSSGSGATSAALDEIVVTARKRAERLQDVPEAISVLSEKTLVSTGIANFNDLGRQTPGITMNLRQTTIPNVVIRGVGAFGNVQGVAFYIDDAINLTDATARIEDVERVEILKGPQGTLYGGASLGGAIRYISKTPILNTTSAEMKGEIGENDYENVYAAVNLPIASDVLATRISGYYTHDDGFVRDATLNANTGRSEEYQARGQLLFQPSSDFKAILTVRYHHVRSGLTYLRANAVDQVSYISNHPFLPSITANTLAGNLTMTYDLGGVKLTSVSAAARQTQKQLLDLTYSAAGGNTLFTPTRSYPIKVYSQELRLTSAEDDVFDWILGAYAQRTENNLAILAPQSIQTAVSTRPFFDYRLRENTFAGFVTGNIHFGDFTLTGGARLEYSSYRAAVAITSGVAINRTLNTNGTVLLPKASLTYKPSRDMTLFATIAKGYISGKVEPTTNPPSIYRPEKNLTFEGGIKGNALVNALTYELIGFYIREKDRQTNNVVRLPSGALIRPVSNVGDSTSKGAEASITLRPTRELTLNGSMAYVDATWSRNAQYAGVSIAGRRVPFTPRWTANGGATYTADLTSTLKYSLHADISYTSSLQRVLTYPPVINSDPSRALVLLRGSISSQDDRWEIGARVENLFDKKYWNEFTPNSFGPANANGICNGCSLGAPGQPRRVIVSVSTKF